MWNTLRNFEAGDFSSWLREGNFIAEPFATYYVLLGLHAIGMAMVVGISFMLASRVLGFQLVVSLVEARRLLGLAWWGFWLNLISGLLLILAQPRREMMTPLFWGKMLMIVVAVWGLRALGRGLESARPAGRGAADVVELVPHAVRVAAAVVSLAWILAIVSGRLVGYTQPPPPL
ncbi:hypothetical protein [Prosthecomicrobium sp. N25]|uniref:hypothetical protein n=1 Tax=Prosthecomicrobium sp. N25 TaxID=3129254 RepID=UPI0030770668